MDDLCGKKALITGAGSGIGKATAEMLARRGTRVVIADLNADSLARTFDSIAAAGGEAHAVVCDVTDDNAIAAMVSAALDRFGSLDCAVNNAGSVGAIAHVSEYPVQAWRDIISLDLTSVFVCMKEELGVMLERGKGSIVNTASVCGLVGLENLGGYNAAKHGGMGLTKTAAIEVAPHGVRVNAVCPGFVVTPLVTDQGVMLKPGTPEFQEVAELHPIGRFGDVNEIAEAICWLCSDASSFVTGHGLVADGGFVAR